MEIVLLNEEKTIKQLVKQDVNKSILEFIESELSKDEYSFIVTSDNLKFAKDKMAELNKSKSFIDGFRKDKVNTESVAIDTFKGNVKAYIALIETKREQIKKDVEVFEAETKKAITKELSLYADELIKASALTYDFNKVEFVDLIVLGSVTAKGALTKKARESIEGRVMACKSKQDKYDMRLLQLQNVSYKAGLESPLTLTHVQGIIMLEDDSKYGLGLESLIASEIGRQDTMKANLVIKAKEEADRNARQDIVDGQNRIRSIFQGGWTTKVMTIEEVRDKIIQFTEYNFSQFAQEEVFATNMAHDQIEILKKIEWSMTQKERAAKSSLSQNKASSTTPINDKCEDGKKIVTIRVDFQIKVPPYVKDSSVVGVVMKRLIEADINKDSIKSIEVV